MTLIGASPGRDLASSLAALCFAIIKTPFYLGRISAVLRKQQAHCPGGLHSGQDCQVYRVIYCPSRSVYHCRMRADAIPYCIRIYCRVPVCSDTSDASDTTDTSDTNDTSVTKIPLPANP